MESEHHLADASLHKETAIRCHVPSLDTLAHFSLIIIRQRVLRVSRDMVVPAALSGWAELPAARLPSHMRSSARGARFRLPPCPRSGRRSSDVTAVQDDCAHSHSDNQGRHTGALRGVGFPAGRPGLSGACRAGGCKKSQGHNNIKCILIVPKDNCGRVV